MCSVVGSRMKSPKGIENALQAPPRSGATTPGSETIAGAMMSARPMHTEAVVGFVALPRPACAALTSLCDKCYSHTHRASAATLHWNTDPSQLQQPVALFCMATAAGYSVRMQAREGTLLHYSNTFVD